MTQQHELQAAWSRIRDKIPGLKNTERAPVVGVLRLQGVIGQVGLGRRGLTLATLAKPIQQVFSLRRLRAVALAINSPGGSPVQSTLIVNRIRAMAAEKDVPVFTFAEDAAASGGYMLALAGDEVFADASSIVGSIGVISSGFGYTDLLEKIGIDRRLYTSGDRKSLLDPFLPEKKADVERLKKIQKEIHQQFMAMVRARRGERLKAREKLLFSGEFWTGERALELGLIDGLGDLRTVMRERYGEKVKLKLVGEDRGLLQRLPFRGLGGHHGWAPGAGFAPATQGWAGDLISALEERALWTRFGL